jgi:hypothetical protein
MNLIKCHKCGKEISIESKFCDDCSTTVDPKKLNLNIIGKPFKLSKIEVAEPYFQMVSYMTQKITVI